jgi:hypothetical protein
MKQTAVEWLVKELNQKIDFIPMEKWEMIRDTVQQAKAMEKEQITYCYDFVSSKICTQCDDFKTGEQYYNETYKGGEQ